MKYVRYIAFCIISIPLISFSQEDKKGAWDKLRVKGYVKTMQTASFSPMSEDIVNDNLIHNRLNFRYQFNSTWKMGLELRNRVFWGESVELVDYGALVDVDNGIIDLSFLMLDKPSIIALSQIDRAWVHWSFRDWEIRAGRQRINWGTNLFWNSNDLFNAYSLVDFDYEERPGTDAIRVQRYFKNESSLDVAVQPGGSAEEWVAAVKYQFNKNQYDYQIIFGNWYTDYVIALGWAGNIRNAGFKGESSYFIPKSNGKSVLSTSISMDYVFSNQLFLTLGVLHNTGGMDTTLSQAENLFLAPVSSKNLMPGKYASLLSVSYPITQLLSTSLVGIYSPGVNSILMMPSISYSLSTALDVSFFAQAFWLEVDGIQNIGNGCYLRLKYGF